MVLLGDVVMLLSIDSQFVSVRRPPFSEPRNSKHTLQTRRPGLSRSSHFVDLLRQSNQSWRGLELSKTIYCVNGAAAAILRYPVVMQVG